MSRVEWQSPIFEKNSHLAKNGQKRPKMTLFRTLTKNGSNDFSNFWYGARGDDYLTFCENRMSKKILVLEIWPKTLSANQIARFFAIIFYIPILKKLFFPKKNQFYFFIPILKKFNFFIFSKKVQKIFYIQILKKFNFFIFSKKLFSVKKMKNWAPVAKLLAIFCWLMNN